MPIIIYDKSKWDDQRQQITSQVQQRYAHLKTQIARQTSSASYSSLLTSQIQQLNSSFSSITQADVEAAIGTSALSDLEKYLSIASQNITSTNSSDIIAFMQALEEINGLMSTASSKSNPIRIDATQWNKFYQKMLQNKNQVMPGVGHISNMLGQIGAAAAQLRMQEVFQNLAKLSSTTPNLLISDTGAKKAEGTKQTITTDILITTPDNSTLQIIGNSGMTSLSVNLSAKFNKYFKSSAQSSTVKPVKLASRTIDTFTKFVPNDRNMYETALYNYISFHRDLSSSHYYFYDYIKGAEKDWQELRRCVGAELLYQELINSGKGSLSFGGSLYSDTIDLYSYGNKLFLADTIAKSAFTKANEISPVATPNLTDKRQQLLKSNKMGTGFEIRGGHVQVGSEAEAEEIISHVTLTYSQKLQF